jgi:TonB family protein
VLCTSVAIVALGTHQVPATTLTAGRLVALVGQGKVPPETLVESFRNEDPHVRAVAARIAATYGVLDVRSHIESALAKESDPVPGAELIRTLLFFAGAEAIPVVEGQAVRIGREARVPVYEWRARTEPARLADALPGIVKQLGAEEARRLYGAVALVSVTLDRPALMSDFLTRVQWVPREGERPLPRNLPVSASLAPMWLPGLLDSAAAATGCELSTEPRFGHIRQTLRPDGRPARIAIDSKGLSQACRDVLAGLGELTFAEIDRPLPRDLTRWLVVPFTKEFAACPPSLPSLDPRDPGQKPPTPIKRRDVRPEYPADMQSKRIEGEVQAEALISESGCIARARVVRSPAVPLSLAALRALSGWKFEPMMINGTPTAVGITATINFTLR